MRYNHYLKFCFLLLTIVLLSCSSGSDIELPEEYATLENVTIHELDEEPSSDIILQSEVSYGDTDDVIIGRFGPTAVDDNGRVFIGDYSEHTIHVYQPDGIWVQQIGREGEGPGEFQNIGDIKIGNGLLHAMDRSQRRISVYDLEAFEFVKDVSLIPESSDDGETSSQYPSSFYTRSDGDYFVLFGTVFSINEENDQQTMSLSLFGSDEGRYLKHNVQSFTPNENLVSRIDGGIMVMSVPYNRRSVIKYENDLMVYARTEDLMIKLFDDQGVYQSAFYYPYPNAELDRNAVLNQYDDRGDQWRQMVQNDDMPDTWPVLDDILPDDENRLWISTITEDQETYDWWVLNTSGELLAKFTWPRERDIQHIKNGYLYSRETDEMGLVQLVRYRVDMPGL